MSWTHIRDADVRGRKQYRCWLCGLRIRKGALHRVRFGYDEGPVTMRMHGVCEAATHDWDEDSWECAATGTEAEFRTDLGIKQ